MSDYPMLISNKLHSFRNFGAQMYGNILYFHSRMQNIVPLLWVFRKQYLSLHGFTK